MSSAASRRGARAVPTRASRAPWAATEGIQLLWRWGWGDGVYVVTVLYTIFIICICMCFCTFSKHSMKGFQGLNV